MHTLLRAAVISGGLFLFGITGCSPLYEGPVTDHFDGSQFYNQEPGHSFFDIVKWVWEMETVAWPEWIADEPFPPPERYAGMGRLRATFINHATVLIQMDSINILTDPIWSDYAGPVSFLGTKRVRAPGVAFDSLPPIDYVLISHDHYDHLDIPTLYQLYKRDHPVILAGLGVKRILELAHIKNTYELDWWDSYAPEPGKTRFVFVPAQHGSGRMPFRENRTLWGGFVIEHPDGNIYYAGDTGYGCFVDSLKKRYNGFRFGILPIGNYEKRWFMKSQHLSPGDAVRLQCELRIGLCMGVHHSTFAEHPEQEIDAHERDLDRALRKSALPDSIFRVLKFGEGIQLEK